MPLSLNERIKKIQLVIFDVDGVLTDGKINVDHNGNEFKMFDVQDGLGIVLFRRSGYKTAIISARASKAVQARAKDLSIDIVKLDAFPKLTAYDEVKNELEFTDDQICFIGDDLADLCIMKRVGLAVAVDNAREEVKASAHFITKTRGGKGAVRELLEMILKSHNKWDAIVTEMSQ